MSEDYGQRLKAARQAAGLTLRDLAARCDVDFTSISHLEHGRFIPSFALGRRFTDVLGVDLLPPSELTQAHARITELAAEVATLRERVAATERQRDLLAGVLGRWQGSFASLDTPTVEALAKERGPVGMGATIELISRDEA